MTAHVCCGVEREGGGISWPKAACIIVSPSRVEGNGAATFQTHGGVCQLNILSSPVTDVLCRHQGFLQHELFAEIKAVQYLVQYALPGTRAWRCHGWITTPTGLHKYDKQQ